MEKNSERIRAVLRFDLKDKARAETLAKSLKPDEKFRLQGLKISSKLEGNSVTIRVSCERGARSLSETLDDLLSAIKMVLDITDSLAK